VGIDGYRVDTVKHVDEITWKELYDEASYAFENWKNKNPKEALDNTPFYMIGEVYNYKISEGREFDFGDKKVDYYDYGFNGLINFELKTDANDDYETIFKKYNTLLNNELKNKSIVNYLTSHDDQNPYDKERKKSIRTANILLLTPGASQIYYGDETARDLTIEGAEGDATLRSFMNWDTIDTSHNITRILTHWKKLGKFRKDHPSVGAGFHKRLTEKPYVFSRSYLKNEYKDKVVIGLDLPKGKKTLYVKDMFNNNTELYDAYSETKVIVENGKIILENDYNVALLELFKK